LDKRDYYDVLGIPRTASQDDVKQAYRKLAREYHPDRNQGDPTAEDRFKEVSEAFTILHDPEKRRRYDRAGHAAFGGADGGAQRVDLRGMGEILEGLVGEVFGIGGSGARRARQGQDIEVEHVVRFEEAALGCEKTITVERTVPCTTCEGTGAAAGTKPERCMACTGTGEVRFQRGFFSVSRPCSSCGGTGKKVEKPCATCGGRTVVPAKEEMRVRLPPGVEDGAVRTVRGAGERGKNGGAPGDLHVRVKIEPHPLFSREGADVKVTVPVSFPQAVLGTQLDVPTLEGRVKMKVPPGTPSGKIFRLRGKGIETLGGAGKGDELVEVIVEVPADITKAQRRLIEELAAELGEAAGPQQKGFLDKLRALFE
jgi:molecular chaperone DnaJ